MLSEFRPLLPVVTENLRPVSLPVALDTCPDASFLLITPRPALLLFHAVPDRGNQAVAAVDFLLLLRHRIALLPLSYFLICLAHAHTVLRGELPGPQVFPSLRLKRARVTGARLSRSQGPPHEPQPEGLVYMVVRLLFPNIFRVLRVLLHERQ